MSIRSLILILFFFLTACKPFPFSAPLTTAEPITINLSPDLAWMQDSLQTCAVATPDTVVFIHSKYSNDLQDVDLTISLGEPLTEESFQVSFLGEEQIILIANPGINIDSLTQLAIRNSYRSPNPQVQAWGYSSRNPTHQLFVNTILEGKTISPHVRLAPNSVAMLAAIANESRAIGYIGQTWLTGDVQVIALDAEQEYAMKQPILGITHSTPSGVSRAILGCLHQALQP